MGVTKINDNDDGCMRSEEEGEKEYEEKVKTKKTRSARTRGRKKNYRVDENKL